MKTLTILPFLLCSCAGSFESAKVAGRAELKLAAAPPPSERCMSLDDGHRDWSAVAAGSGALAGASGIASIPEYSSKELRIGLAAGTVAMGALAVFAVKEADGFASSWAQECAGK